MNGPLYISVILPLKLEWEPCYRADETVEIGNRVKVIFANKEYTGVVSGTGITPDVDPSKIRPILSVDKSTEMILPSEIALWRQVAEYYLCSVGEVYKAAYPLGKINLEEARAAAKQKAAQRLERIAQSIRVRIDKLEIRLDKKQEQAEKAKEGTKTKATLTADIEKLKEDILRSNTSLNVLLSGGTHNLCNETDSNVKSVALSDAQTKAYEDILTGFNNGKPVLLHGITGSGKTEIYIELSRKAMKEGKNILYLVPEIALSRQLEERLEEHFGTNLHVFHSGESAASKRNTAEIIRESHISGNNYIVLGTRSSLFLPHHNLGLIIVDEEHDNSYKQDSPAPRYNGRDTALMLNMLFNNEGQKCNIILGSATPSLEELYNCQVGKHHYVRLSERFHKADESLVEIIDTKAERRKRGMISSISIKLIEHIRQTLSSGQQILVLRSRRAWSSALQCDSCGDLQKCPHCNVSLSYHKAGNCVKCHYCGYSAAFTGQCSKCSGTLSHLGAGTQKIEEELATLFPEARIARLDSDTSQNQALEKKTIKEFSKGEIDILVGTQMITKGFDFEKLSLVVVIAADTLLSIQDFRADEKAIQILEQFRGRCGRRGNKGMFVIQTSQPEHPIYTHLLQDDRISFNSHLLQERKDFGFPPYARIVEITLKDSNEKREEAISNKLAARLRMAFPELVTGPYSPAVDRIADQHIRKIRLSLKKDRSLSQNKSLIKTLISSFEKECRYDGHITLDVDPS